MRKENEKTRFEMRFYEGYKKEETPRSIIIGDRELKIESILWRKRARDQKSGKAFEVFKCKIGDDLVRITVDEAGKKEISFLPK